MTDSGQKTAITPIPYLAGVFGAAGAAKLIGLSPVKRNFARWGYSTATRRLVGFTEVAIAGAAVGGLEDPVLRRAAGASSVLIMAGALQTHARAGEGKLSYIAPLVVAVLGVATYFDSTLVLEP